MMTENYMQPLTVSRKEVFVDTLVRLRHLTLDIVLRLGKYSDISDDEMYQIGRVCNTTINHLELKKYDKTKDGLMKINCGSFRAKSSEYDEILTYFQDQWRLEIIGIWLSIEFMRDKEVDKMVITQVINQITNSYNQKGLKTWDL